MALTAISGDVRHHLGDKDEEETGGGSKTAAVTDEVHETDDEEQVADKYLCGLGSCKPRCLQRLNNPEVALAFLCWFALVQGFIVNGITNVDTTSWEVRYGFSSKTVSLITVAYDTAAGILVLPITYFGARAHQMRMLAFAALIMASGSLVMVIAHWADGVYQLGTSMSFTCSDNLANATSSEASCPQVNSGGFLAVFIIGEILHCFGGTTLYSIGIVYIDSNYLPGPSAFRQGILYAISTLGPALGFIIGGVFIDIYVDVDKVPASSITITPDDPRWVGAWWIGYLVGCACAISVFLTLLPYPKEFKSTENIRQQRLAMRIDQTEALTSSSLQQLQQKGGTGGISGEVSTTGEDYVDRSKMPKLRDVPKALRSLFTNFTFVFVSLASAVELFLVAGTAVFISQFIQYQFYQKPGTAAMIGGGIAIPGTVIGQVVGGYICRRFSLGVRGMLRFCIITTALSIVVLPCLLARCPTTILAGVSEPYFGDNSPSSGSSYKLSDTCNKHCPCTTYTYDPLCDVSTGLQYFSGCYAGCDEWTTNYTGTAHKVYVNCTCVPATSNRTLTEGRCAATECNMMYVFIPTFLILIIITFFITVPALNVTLRCVQDDERSFAIGVQWCFMRFLGSVPGPLVFGVVFDSACLVWQEGCGAVGTCWVTDNDALAYRFLTLFGSIQVVGLILFCCSYVANERATNRRGDLDVTKSDDLDGGSTVALERGSGPHGSINPAATVGLVDVKKLKSEQDGNSLTINGNTNDSSAVQRKHESPKLNSVTPVNYQSTNLALDMNYDVYDSDVAAKNR